MPTFIGVDCFDCGMMQVIQKPKNNKFNCRGVDWGETRSADSSPVNCLVDVCLKIGSV